MYLRSTNFILYDEFVTKNMPDSMQCDLERSIFAKLSYISYIDGTASAINTDHG
jgi:hypothetical protein